jgi:basic membrane protein A
LKRRRDFFRRQYIICGIEDEADLKELSSLIQQGYDLLIGIGFENADCIETLAKEHPDRKFAVVDAVVDGDNVASIVYRAQEGDFLMGVLAARLTQSKRVGFIGGMDIAIIRRIESGFKQGVTYQDSDVEVLSDMAGTFARITSSGWRRSHPTWTVAARSPSVIW